MISPTRAFVASIAVTVLLATAACSGDAKKKASPSVSATTSAAASSSTPAPAPAPARKLNPYTGLGSVPTTPTIAVKIDDTPPGRPQVAIDLADIVYIEEAEGGLSRLAAIFGSHKPTVGYVRSTRPSDPDLLLQFGRITEAASGGGHDALPLLDKSGIKGWINDRGAAYYHRQSRNESSYINLLLDLFKVAKDARTALPKPMGFTFAAASPQLSTAQKAIDIHTRVGSQVVEFRYSYTLHKYIRYIDGVAQRAADGQLVATRNVIVQTCRIIPHPQDTDVNGNPSQFTITVGHGAVAVFRDGKRIDGSWIRGALSGGTLLRTSKGAPILLGPGNTWVALVRPGVGATSH